MMFPQAMWMTKQLVTGPQGFTFCVYPLYKTRCPCRASGRLGSMSESESAILNSVVTEEDEEGEQSRSESASSRHLLGER